MRERKIKIKNELLFYDQLLLFLGEDAYECRYLCMLVEEKIPDELPVYLCTPISPHTEERLRNGEIDVRFVFKNGKEFHTTNIEGETGILEPYKEEIGEAWLPEEGLILEPEDFALQYETSSVLQEAQKRQKCVLHLRLDTPESETKHTILLEDFASITLTLQKLLKHAYNKVAQKTKHLKRDFPDAYVLELYGTSPGSIIIELEEHHKNGLLENLGLRETLRKLDELVHNSDSTEKAIETLTKNKGHLAASYLNLLRSLQEGESSLDYSWATPASENESRGFIDKKALTPLIEALEAKQLLQEEILSLEGYFKKVDVDNGYWTLWDVENQASYSGGLAEGTEDIFKGVTIETQLYQILCNDVLERTRTGKETQKLYLMELTETAKTEPSGDK